MNAAGMKDHYKTLGVKPSATPAEIKKAYRALAVKYHPDKNPDNTLAEAQFKEVQEANATISDPRKRALYDDERWLAGMGARTSYKEAVTPAWLLEITNKLNADLATMDTYRMSHRALRDYILLILSDAHLAILQKEATDEIKHKIIMGILKAAGKIETKYQTDIIPRLNTLAGADEHLAREIYAQIRDKQRAERRDKLFPYIVLLVTLALCMLMYVYTQWPIKN